MILSTLIDMSGVIFVDEVTYMIALEAFSHFSHMKVVPGRNLAYIFHFRFNDFRIFVFQLVPLSEDGPNIAELKRIIQENKIATKDKLFWGMYYTVPTYHNPTGILFSESEFATSTMIFLLFIES